MKCTFLVVLLMLLAAELPGQVMKAMNEDSLLSILKIEKDTTAVSVLLQLAGSYFFKQPGTSLTYARAAVDSCRKLKDEMRLIKSLIYAGEASRLGGDFLGGLEMLYEANQLSRDGGHKYWEANSAGSIGTTYFDLQNFEKSLTFLKRAIAIHRTLPPDEHEARFNVYAARDYLDLKEYDSAYYYLKAARQFNKVGPWAASGAYRLAFGDYYYSTGQTDSAYFYFKAALVIVNRGVGFSAASLAAAKLSSFFSLKNQPDSSIYFARLGFKIATDGKFIPRIMYTSRRLAEHYEKMGNADSTLYYLKIENAMRDSIFGISKIAELQFLQLEEQRRNLEIQQAQERYQNNIRLIGLISVTAIILIASVLLFRSNRIKQKTNQVLQQALAELKATQSQLIQSEKMASLGELTAGIAHEIQNPLNFVNNFSEVNSELIDDLRKELASGSSQTADEIALAIKENEAKINHHGKRADGIVKSMLQHSRSSSGQKELTDVNSLCDEYLRLAYHGFRAKDKSFNTTIEKSLDLSIPNLNIVPQDIGRVILNLINNAFYAVGEKAKTSGNEYIPTVKVSTRRLENVVEINVEDNGGGVPDEIKSKIFQPFFTTKPAGQGTGLGLSLSYDIIKAHGGTLRVSSNVGEGSEFVIQLPD